MGDLKQLKGQAKDLSDLSKTPKEKSEEQALNFVDETRQAITVMFQEMVKMTGAINELYKRTDFLLIEVNKLKGVDLQNGKGTEKTENGGKTVEEVNNADSEGKRQAGQ